MDNIKFVFQEFDKQLGILFIFLFTLSVSFPIVASVINKKGTILKTFGYFDITLALLCFLLFVLFSVAKKKSDDLLIIKKSQQIVELAATIPLLLITLYFMGLKVNWTILVIGLGWRFWLLIMVIPYLVTIFYQRVDTSNLKQTKQ